jgi:hypothetical protein
MGDTQKGDMRNAYKMLINELFNERDHLGDLSVKCVFD